MVAMLEESYSAAWLAPRTRPATWRACCREHARVRVVLFSLLKGVIRTPMTNGKVDYDQVPVGASIWVTVTDEGSPLHGRPILITKRPDGQFALEGGSGYQHWHDKGGTDEAGRRVAARRHLVLNVGSPRSTAADKALAGKLQERDVKKEQFLASRRAAAHARREAAKQTRKAFNIPENVVFNRQDLAEHKGRLTEALQAGGAAPEEAQKWAGAVVRDMGVLSRRFNAYHVAKRAALARDVVGGQMLPDLATNDAHPDAEASVAHDPAQQFDFDYQPAVDAILAAQARKEEQGLAPLSEAEAEQLAQRANEQQLQEALDASDPAPSTPEDDAAELAEEGTPPQPGADQVLGEAGPPVAAFPDQADLGEFGAGGQAGGSDISFVPPEEAPPPPPLPKKEKPPPKYTLAKIDAWTAANVDEAAQSLDAFRREVAARTNAQQLKEELKEYEGLRLITPAAIDRQALTADPVGDEAADKALDELLEHYRRQATVPEAGRFYEAIGDHWNDAIPYADGIGAFAEKGAISAVTGILGDTGMLDARIDVGRIVQELGIEAAAYALAGNIAMEHGKTRLNVNGQDVNKIDDLVARLTHFNATTLKQTEDRALDRHAELQRQATVIDDALQTGELALEELGEGETRPDMATTPNARVRWIKERAHAEGTRLLAENIYAQRQNLGAALGSMQMSATLLHALEATAANARRGDPQAQFVTLHYGDNKIGRDEAMKKLRLTQGAMVADHDLRMGHSLRIDTTKLHRYISRIQGDGARNEDWEKTKTSDAGVQDRGGQEVVPEYTIPFFKETFTDADGEEKPAYVRRNQRNDIEWLRKSGGGVITRTTGAGKTNTTLGFMAHQLQANPNYHGVVAVPATRAEQWAKEAANFTTLPVHLVPDNAKPHEVDHHLRDFNAKQGGVLLLSHKLAARHAEQLQTLYASGKLHGLALDEPQEMMGAAKTAKLTGGAQALMKVGQRRETVPTKAGGERVVATPDPKFHRIALTATPAKREPVQAYDLVNWTNPGALGPRTRFRRAFEGFSQGTNAADNALARMVYKEIGPYVSGDEEVTHPFDLKVAEHQVQRTPAQRARQKAIETTAASEMKRLSDERVATLKKNPVNKARTPQQLRRDANAWARERVADQHRHNLDAGEVLTDAEGRERLADPAQAGRENAKIQAFLHQVDQYPRSDKHVVFVNGPHQRAAVTQALRDKGYSQNAIKNMTREAGGQSEARKLAWKQGGADVPFLLIDRQSASGHNLQEGDHLHVLGAPDDAAQLLQAQGRVARGNKTTDTTIHTYKTTDSPFESRDWERIDGGMKLMSAVAPGLAKKFVSQAAKARDRAVAEYGRAGAPRSEGGEDLAEAAD